jgi:SCA7, zinc-binding domain
MGAKRAVVGRSQPYDVLLAAYQKKSIGRPQSKLFTFHRISIYVPKCLLSCLLNRIHFKILQVHHYYKRQMQPPTNYVYKRKF